MISLVGLVLAVIAGLGAALLASTSPSVQADGQSATCTALLVRFEEGDRTVSQARSAPPTASDPAADNLARACDDKQDQWALLAGLATLVCLAAGSIAHFKRPDEVVGPLSGVPTRI